MLAPIFSPRPSPFPTPAEIFNRIVCSSDIGVEKFLGELTSDSSEALEKFALQVGGEPKCQKLAVANRLVRNTLRLDVRC